MAATCEKGGYTLYSCLCGKSYKEDITAALGHKVSAWTEKETKLESAARCMYKVTYEGTCVNCGETRTKTETAEKHEWTVEIVSSATCVSKGIKGTFCTHKECEYNKKALINTEYGDELAHSWKYAGLSGFNRSYVCEYCGEEKIVMDYSGKTEANISREDAKKTTEIVLKEASMSLDEALKDALPENATLGAEKLSDAEINAATAGMDEADKKLLGDAPVYSFSLTSDGENVDFAGGSVTISLPYTLQKGENPDSVIVWYLADDGSVSRVDAVYSGGKVVFTLTHFSYYAVLEMDTAEYCAQYGHDTLTVTAPTCTEDGKSVCPRCNQIVATAPATGHNWSSTVISELSETTNGVVRFTCSGCGKTYDTITPAPGHVHSLTLVPAVAADCLNEGNIAYYTCDCGMLFSDAEGSETLENLSATVVEATGHTIENIDALAATCTTKGHTAGARCSVCGVLLFGNEETECVAHSYVGTVTDPTCTEQGYTTYVCSVCGDSYVADYVPEYGHDYRGSYTPPTCTEQGYVTHTCSRCGDTYTDGYVAAKGHDYYGTVTAPTCTEMGYTTYVCIECRDTYEDDYVNAHGHSYGDWSVVSSATCLEEGLKEQFCIYCSDRATEVLPALGHDYVAVVTDPKCTENGYTTHTCSRCGDYYIDTYVQPTGHTEAVRTEIPASCTSSGLSVTYCTVCGTDISSSAIAMLDHTPAAAVKENAVPSDCVTAGHHDEVVYCSVCHTELSRNTVADELLPHNYVNGVCTVCSGCSHIPVNTEVISLNSGNDICAGADIVVRKCQCGQKVSRVWADTEWNKLAGQCLFFINTNETEDLSAYHYNAVCMVCGLTVDVSGTVEKVDSSCNYIPHLTTKITLGSSTILEVDSCSDVVNGCNFEQNTHYLNEYYVGYPDCYYLDVCTECGAVGNVYEEFIKFNEDAYDEPEGNMYLTVTSSAYTDAEGRVHTVTVQSESLYDLSWTEDVYYEELSACTKKKYVQIHIAVGDRYETDESYETLVHDDSFVSFVRTDGKNDCSEGYAGYYQCSCCKKTELVNGTGHKYVSKQFDTMCSYECLPVTYDCCELCGRVTNLQSYHLRYLDTESTYIDYYSVRKCKYCSLRVWTQTLTWEEDIYGNPIQSGCITEKVELYTFTSDGESAKHLAVTTVSDNHQYGEKEYTISSSGCDGGIIITQSCAVCNKAVRSIVYGHEYVRKTLDTSFSGRCSGTVQYDECIYCGKDKNVFIPYKESHSYDSYGENENGVKIEKCSICGLEKTWGYVKTVENCMAYSVGNYGFSINGEILVYSETRSSYSEHDSETIVTHTKPTCDGDEWQYTYVCKNCGDTFEGVSGTGHYAPDSYCAFYRKGTINASIDQYPCVFCNEIVRSSWWDSGFNYTPDSVESDGSLRYNSSTGGKYYKIVSSSIVIDGCTAQKTYIVQYYWDEGEKCDDAQTVIYLPEEYHTYSTSYELCGDLYAHIVRTTSVCTVCGKREVSYSRGHVESRTYINLADYGMCGGQWVTRSCLACGEVIKKYYSAGKTNTCQWTRTANSWSSEVYICTVCGGKRTYTKEVIYEDCTETYRESTIITMGETEIVNYVYENTRENHRNSTETYTLKGTSCEDGWILTSVCDDCGEVLWTDEGTEHSYGEEAYYSYCIGSSASYCIGSSAHCVDIYESHCIICGKKDEKQSGEAYANCLDPGVMDENGDVVASCGICGLVYREHIEFVQKSDCTLAEIKYITLRNGDEILYYKTEESTYVRHTWFVNGVASGTTDFTGDGSAYNSVSCSVCGLSFEFRNDMSFGDFERSIIVIPGVCRVWQECYINIISGEEEYCDISPECYYKNYYTEDGWYCCTCWYCDVTRAEHYEGHELENGKWQDNMVIIFRREDEELCRIEKTYVYLNEPGQE